MDEQDRSHTPPAAAAPTARDTWWRSVDEVHAGLRATGGGGEAAQETSTFSRREFVQTLSLAMAAATAGGCAARQPPEQIVPYAHTPDHIVPGRPLFFATALTRDGFALGVLGESHTGRPTKIEGNGDHPTSLSATDVFAQAGVMTLYDPDRSRAVRRDSQIASWEQLSRELQAALVNIRAHKGRGVRVLTPATTSPTLHAQIGKLLEELPEARWHSYAPVGIERSIDGARIATGQALKLVYRVARAERILALDCDFLYSLPGAVRYAREFSDRRRMRAPADGRGAMNRLYSIEPSISITGSSADHHLPLRTMEIVSFTIELARELGVQPAQSKLVERQWGKKLHHEARKWLEVLVRELESHRGSSLVMAGEALPPALHALVLAINERLGNLGKTVIGIHPPDHPAAGLSPRGIEDLVREMQRGEVDLLAIIAANPVYDTPVDLQFAEQLKRVETSIHMGLYLDETARRCTWHVPQVHELEAWSDARAHEGTASIIQPLIAPLFGGRSPHALLHLLRGQPPASDLALLQAHWREYWRAQKTAQPFEHWWRRTLRDGVVLRSSFPEQPLRVSADAVRSALELLPRRPALQPAAAQDSDTAAARGTKQPSGTDEGARLLEVVFKPDPTIWDGRWSNNAWLQELPKPPSTITWQNAVFVGPTTAQRLGLKNEQRVRLSYRGRSLVAPVWVAPGHAEQCATLTLGYGRSAGGRNAAGRGYSAYSLRQSDAPWFDQGLRIHPLDGHQPLATTQNHHRMEGRELVREGKLEQFREDPHALARRAHPRLGTRPSLLPEWPHDGTQWGMVIDLSTCIGCGACTMACQAENNIPVVGEREVRTGREMHWIRVDHYYKGSPSHPRVLHQPVPCMHCEKAPCELVCPVEATKHSSDGLNEMLYQRCIGTRYCSNNCPYKVRRFNFLYYAELDEPTLQLVQNPEVTVRGRGAMEKCTYCVQRIRRAEIEARKQDNRPLQDGEVKTACQEVCPTRAIIFGNINDRHSRVSLARQQPHNYALLAELNTQPRTTYLAAVRNPNPELE